MTEEDDYSLVRGRRDSYKRETVCVQRQKVMTQPEAPQGFLIHNALCVTIDETNVILKNKNLAAPCQWERAIFAAPTAGNTCWDTAESRSLGLAVFRASVAPGFLA